MTALTFVEYQERWSLLPSQVVLEMFHGLPEREQAEAWAELAERSKLRIESELQTERQMEESWCPECHDRTVRHEPGDCQRHQSARRSPAATSTNPARVPVSAGDDPLKAVPPHVYFEAVAGIVVPPNGWVSCPKPDHEDRHPSCKVTSTHWRCWSCGAGGSIIDLGAAIYAVEPTGWGYREIRRRLLADLGLVGRSA